MTKRMVTLLILLCTMSIIKVNVHAEKNIERVYGSDRIETSIEISKKARNKSNVVILSSTTGEVDSLAGTILAKYESAPLLLIKKNEVPQNILNEINRLGATNVYLLGGTNTISQNVEDNLKVTYDVDRVSGNNRVETAIKISEEVKGSSDEFFLTLGFDSLVDALAIGPVSATKQIPILLTQKDELPLETLNKIIKDKPKKITIIGGYNAVSKKVEEQIPQGIEIKRVSGNNREDTAINIANSYYTNLDSVIIANGWKIADALAGGHLASSKNIPILLTNVDKVTENTVQFIRNKSKNVTILGGENAVNRSILNRINGIINTPIPPLESTASKTDTIGKLKVELSKKINTNTRPTEISIYYYGNDRDDNKKITNTISNLYKTGKYNISNLGSWITYIDKNDNNRTKITLDLTYRTTDKEELYIDTQIDKILGQIIKPNMSEYDKVLAVHDYLVDNTTYSNTTANSPYTAYTLFKENAGVCNAYALSFSRMMDKLKIDNFYVSGQAKGKSDKSSGLHAWNKVKIDNVWYNIDATWDHPAAKYGLHNAYYYFLVSDKRFYKTHTPDILDMLPLSNNAKYDGMFDKNFNKNKTIRTMSLSNEEIIPPTNTENTLDNNK